MSAFSILCLWDSSMLLSVAAPHALFHYLQCSEWIYCNIFNPFCSHVDCFQVWLLRKISFENGPAKLCELEGMNVMATFLDGLLLPHFLSPPFLELYPSSYFVRVLIMLGPVMSSRNSVKFTKPLLGPVEQSHIPGGSFPRHRSKTLLAIPPGGLPFSSSFVLDSCSLSANSLH